MYHSFPLTKLSLSLSLSLNLTETTMSLFWDVCHLLEIVKSPTSSSIPYRTNYHQFQWTWFFPKASFTVHCGNQFPAQAPWDNSKNCAYGRQKRRLFFYKICWKLLVSWCNSHTTMNPLLILYSVLIRIMIFNSRTALWFRRWTKCFLNGYT